MSWDKLWEKDNIWEIEIVGLFSIIWSEDIVS